MNRGKEGTPDLVAALRRVVDDFGAEALRWQDDPVALACLYVDTWEYAYTDADVARLAVELANDLRRAGGRGLDKRLLEELRRELEKLPPAGRKPSRDLYARLRENRALRPILSDFRMRQRYFKAAVAEE